MGYQDVTSCASSSTTFPKNSGRGESLGITTHPKTVVGGKQGHAPSKILLLQQSLFVCQSSLMEIIGLSHS